ncbi:Nucleolar GTP-binding protein 1 [Bacidia gigantensis]|uniref:Nucleolar GTP-binding protein 1 n=1 Tax=Bacidia gigantensis TaxID=2732470 RepID=UPI001D0513A0|nr:Nucleolar GTP-binding protein 1 [Bacidia gigantensis]KAG8531694.1 Nucleolar GTP-binding protein 1 [Bacidia gigantensis]
MKTTWKDIAPVPSNQEFLDVVLSRTQRRLPTQIRPGFKISRIRGFYTRKVKFTQETFSEKLGAILEGFPRLQDIHPFHKDLLNTLYDADHFKIALGQLSTAKHLIETVSRDYVRLLKYAPSLYQCKQLKRAALGRMATICRRLKDPLVYLEQVRQHLGRLPSIDPNTRTLLICGYPNVGKSSFLRSITRADVDVQPYAFTTKSLFVGHFDYKYLRFQAIDTPGILDHRLEEMNTIEMQSITAIAHLRSAILYFMDLSEQCGYTVASQIQLFQSIKPLFANKLVLIVVNKIDLCKPEDLDAETKAQLDGILQSGSVELLQLSCTTTEGITEVKNAACERLIADRVAQKLKAGTNSSGTVGGRLGNVLNRIHVAQPLGGIVREPFIPEAIRNMRKFSKDDPFRPRLAREIEEENGGAGVFNVNLRQDYKLDNDDWKEDRVPEFLNGRNIADFIDADIESKLEALEAEEEDLQAKGFYNSDEDLEDAHTIDIRMRAEVIRKKQDEIREEAKMRKSLKNRALIPRAKLPKKLSVMEDSLDRLGYDTTAVTARARSQSRGRTLQRAESEGDAMDVDIPESKQRAARAKSMVRSQSNRREDGVKTVVAREKAERLMKLGQQRMNRAARQGEADRHTTSAKPKHLFTGKRGMGKTDRRTCAKPAACALGPSIISLLSSRGEIVVYLCYGRGHLAASISGLGEAAGIAGLITLAGQGIHVSSALYTFIKTYKAVGPKLLEVADEVQRLQGTLNGVEAIVTHAPVGTWMSECCLQLQSKLKACETKIQRWKERIALDLSGSSKPRKFFRDVKIASNHGFFGELRSQVVQCREELILELSVFQSATGCLVIEKSQATFSSLETLRGHQEDSFSTISQNMKRSSQRLGNSLQVSDIAGIERRLDMLSKSLQQVAGQDLMLMTGPMPTNTSQSRNDSQISLVDAEPAAIQKRVDRPLQAENCRRWNMVFRLVQPAILACDHDGKFRQTLVALETPKVAALGQDQLLPLLQCYLDLRLIIWLIQRTNIHAFSFAGGGRRSLLFREAQVSFVCDIQHRLNLIYVWEEIKDQPKDRMQIAIDTVIFAFWLRTLTLKE